MAIATELELSNVLRHIVSSAKRLANAHYAALGVLDESGTVLRDFVYDGIEPTVATTIGDLPEGRGILGRADPFTAAAPPRRLGDHPASCGFPPGHPPMTTFLGVPITVRGRSVRQPLPHRQVRRAPRSRGDEALVVVLADAAGVGHRERPPVRALDRRAAAMARGATTITARMLAGARSR